MRSIAPGDSAGAFGCDAPNTQKMALVKRALRDLSPWIARLRTSHPGGVLCEAGSIRGWVGRHPSEVGTC